MSDRIKAIKERMEQAYAPALFTRGMMIGDLHYLLTLIGRYEKALEFYGDEKLYFMRDSEIDLNQTTAVFKEQYRKNNDLTKPNIHKGKTFECSARLKVDQGKTARSALAEKEDGGRE